MKDVFADLMAYLFAEDRRNHPISARHGNRVLEAVRQSVHSGSHRKNKREDDRPDEGQESLI